MNGILPSLTLNSWVKDAKVNLKQPIEGPSMLENFPVFKWSVVAWDWVLDVSAAKKLLFSVLFQIWRVLPCLFCGWVRAALGDKWSAFKTRRQPLNGKYQNFTASSKIPRKIFTEKLPWRRLRAGNNEEFRSFKVKFSSVAPAARKWVSSGLGRLP